MNEELLRNDKNILVTELKALVGTERETTAKIIRYLQVVIERKLFLDYGCSSIFTFCTEYLGYSHSSAWRRLQAAKCCRENPELVTKFEEGSVTLCTIAELSRVPIESRKELVPVIEGKSNDEVKKLVAEYLPAVPSFQERVTVSKVSIPSPLPLFPSDPEAGKPDPLRYSVTLDLTEEEYRLLEEVKTLSGAYNRKDAVTRALRIYRKIKSPAEREKRRAMRRAAKISGAAAAPHARQTTISRAIPVAVRDQVTVRDGGQCTYVGIDGRRCSERCRVEIDHVRPWAFGGGHEEQNLRVLCAGHNRDAFRGFREMNDLSVHSIREIPSSFR